MFLLRKTSSPAIAATIFDFWPREPEEETKWGEGGGRGAVVFLFLILFLFFFTSHLIYKINLSSRYLRF